MSRASMFMASRTAGPHSPMGLSPPFWGGKGHTRPIYEPSQYVYGLKNGVAEQLGINADNVRVINPYVGGAFGSKGSMTPRTAIIASIARQLGRPVKLVATAIRDSTSRPTAPRPATR